jgi:uncharacterized protein YecT (DUF1311 family)
MFIRCGYVSIVAISIAIAIPITNAAWGKPTEPNSNRSIAQTTQKLNCSNPGSLSQLDLNECAAQAAKVADRKLNQVYQKLIASLDKPQKNKLIDSQLAWIKFRDKECDFAASRYEGGSIAPLKYSDCVRSLTVQRTKDLEFYLEGY